MVVGQKKGANPCRALSVRPAHGHVQEAGAGISQSLTVGWGWGRGGRVAWSEPVLGPAYQSARPLVAHP